MGPPVCSGLGLSQSAQSRPQHSDMYVHPKLPQAAEVGLVSIRSIAASAFRQKFSVQLLTLCEKSQSAQSRPQHSDMTFKQKLIRLITSQSAQSRPQHSDYTLDAGTLGFVKGLNPLNRGLSIQTRGAGLVDPGRWRSQSAQSRPQHSDQTAGLPVRH